MSTLLSLVMAGVVPLVLGLTPVVAHAEDQLVFELRTYHANEGKIDALHARFREHTLKLFEKHNMRNVAYWQPLEQPDTLIYVIAHDSREVAETNWRNFVADPDWRAVYAASTADGRLVKEIESVFMTATDYSP